jgi:hypothetical protein
MVVALNLIGAMEPYSTCTTEAGDTRGLSQLNTRWLIYCRAFAYIGRGDQQPANKLLTKRSYLTKPTYSVKEGGHRPGTSSPTGYCP